MALRTCSVAAENAQDDILLKITCRIFQVPSLLW